MTGLHACLVHDEGVRNGVHPLVHSTIYFIKNLQSYANLSQFLESIKSNFADLIGYSLQSYD